MKGWRAFRRLSVFSGGCTFEAAGAIDVDQQGAIWEISPQAIPGPVSYQVAGIGPQRCTDGDEQKTVQNAPSGSPARGTR